MKPKLMLAACAALCAMVALPASAQDYRHHRRGSDYRPAEITVRTDRGEFTVDRGDRLYYRLMEGPYHFKDGRTYTYTDNCHRSGCEVIVYDPYGRQRRYDRIIAPPIPGERGRGWEGRRDRRDRY